MDKFVYGVIMALLVWSLCFWVIYDAPHEIKYDCRLAEISVDYPQAVKEQCRKLLEK